MPIVAENSIVEVVMTLVYTTPSTSHIDNFYCHSVNMWRDYFPIDMRAKLLGLRSGEVAYLAECENLLTYYPEKVLTVRRAQWRPAAIPASLPEPRLGRWYPQGFLHQVAGVFPQSGLPFRVIDFSPEIMQADCNHPLGGHEISVTAEIVRVSSTPKERGGRCADWFAEAAADGPGMQLFLPDKPVDFSQPGALRRQVEGDDSLFYASPRLVDHVDSCALQHLRESTGRYLPVGIKVLDLMSSAQSHLDGGYVVTGVGMNRQELESNPALTDYLVHDLNSEPLLPFDDDIFDAVCCHLSFEYLLHPQKIIAETARVLRRKGVVLISFSNRWFPEKVTNIWTELHEFERLGYVMHFLPEYFEDLSTVSFRNWPRPADDRYSTQIINSDPVYLVTAHRK